MAGRRWGAFVMLIGSWLAAACSAAPAAPAPAATEAPKTELVLAIGGESVDGYDPTLGWGRYGAPLFQSTLLRRDADLRIVNDLATDYSVSADGLTWSVAIRDDAVFSDGVPLTAEDVAYTFNQAAQSGGLTDVTVLERAVATGPTRVEFRLKQPQSTFVNRLITLGIVPQHAHGPEYARRPIGSGPYRLVAWEPGKQLIVEANPRYYGKQPAFERLVFLFVDAAGDGALIAARAGQVDVAGIPQSFAQQPVSGMRLVAVPSVDNRGILFPYVPAAGATTASGAPIGNSVTADLAIRRAVNYALDRRALVDGILEGYGAPAFGPVSGLPWEAPEVVVADADVAQARQILADSGWADGDGDGIVEKDGQRAAFTLIYPAGDTIRQALALSAADMVRPAGIQIDVTGKAWDEIEQLMHSNAVLFGWGSHDQTELYNLHHSSQAGRGFYNTGFYANAAIDDVLDLAMGAPSEQEAIVFWKQAQWDGTQGFSTRGDAAWAWLVNLYHTYLVDECLDVGRPQIEPHGHGWPITAGILDWRWTC